MGGLLSAAVLSTWSYGFAVIDAWSALAGAGLVRAPGYVAVPDHRRRALRGAPGIVDALARVSRGRNVAHPMTHCLDGIAASASW